MIHLTLNTGNVSLVNTSDDLEDWNPTTGSLPEPYDRYSVRISYAPGAAFFDLELEKEALTTNAIAWTNEGASEIWPLIHSHYTSLFRAVPLVDAPVSIPWLATLVYPSPKIFETSLSSSLEQAIAFRIIKSA